MSRRALPACLLTAALLAGLTAATISPAAAQGDPVEGEGNVYFLSGAYNDSGIAQATLQFGDPYDEVYFGDWYGEGVDLPMVRRGNIFFVLDADDHTTPASAFAYGDEEDEVYIGDWDGDGVDSIAVRRGNEYFVKNDNRTSGIADRVFTYGDPVDYVLVGNWNGELVAPTADQPGKGDTLTVVRGNEFFVKNVITTGVADYTFLFGDPEDELLVGDWAQVAGSPYGAQTITSSDGADQLAVRRGNVYHLSSEFADAAGGKAGLATQRVFAYAEVNEHVFVAALPTALDAKGKVTNDQAAATSVITGDGLGVRR
jgi:hypothetical protein